MSYLLTQLKILTEKAKNESSEQKPILSIQDRVEQLLLELPPKLLKHARSGHNRYTLLMVESRSQRLNEYEQLIFEGVNKLGVPVEVKESFTPPPGPESEGFYMYAYW